MLIVRYLAATTAASICFVCLLTVPILWSLWGNVSGEIILSDLVVTPILVVITAAMAIPLALP